MMEPSALSGDECDAEFDRMLALSGAKCKRFLTKPSDQTRPGWPLCTEDDETGSAIKLISAVKLPTPTKSPVRRLVRGNSVEHLATTNPSLSKRNEGAYIIINTSGSSYGSSSDVGAMQDERLSSHVLSGKRKPCSMDVSASFSDESESEFDRLLALSAAKSKSVRRSSLRSMPTDKKRDRRPFRHMKDGDSQYSTTSELDPPTPIRRIIPNAANSDEGRVINHVEEIRTTSASPLLASVSKDPIIILSTSESGTSGSCSDVEGIHGECVTPRNTAEKGNLCKVDASGTGSDESEAEFDHLLALSAIKSKSHHRPSSMVIVESVLARPRWPFQDTDLHESRSSTARREHPTTTKPSVPSISNSSKTNSSLVRANEGPILIRSTSESSSEGADEPVTFPKTANRRTPFKVKQKLDGRKTQRVAKTSTAVRTFDECRTTWQGLFDDNSVGNKLDDVGFTREDADRFLHSLDIDIPRAARNPAAVPFVDDFKRNRGLLVERLFRLYNAHVFDNRLARDTQITWNSRMTNAAGLCKCIYANKATGTKTFSVELSVALLKTADRVRDTLVHELCHAATWMLSEYWDVHGPFWRCWARRANIVFPSLPAIGRCHNYKK